MSQVVCWIVRESVCSRRKPGPVEPCQEQVVLSLSVRNAKYNNGSRMTAQRCKRRRIIVPHRTHWRTTKGSPCQSAKADQASSAYFY